MSDAPGRSAPYAGLSGHELRAQVRSSQGEQDTQARPAQPPQVQAAASAFLPLLLFGLAFIAWTVFQTVELVGERVNLHSARTAQQPQLEQAQRLRNSLSSLAADTQRLADGGDAGAKQVIDRLRQNGITVNPNAPVAAPPP
jgi:hypothetical protein